MMTGGAALAPPFSERTIAMSNGKMIVANALGCGLWAVFCERLGLPSILLYGGMVVIMAAFVILLLSAEAAADRTIKKMESEWEAEDRRNHVSCD